MNKCQINDSVAKQMTIRHWMRLGLLCRTLVRRHFHLCSGAVLGTDRYVHKICFGAGQIFMRINICMNICTRFLCMHKILVHAQHSCACTTLLCMHWRGQGPTPGPKKSAEGPAWGNKTESEIDQVHHLLNSIGNTIGNSIGNSIGNTIGNSIGNSIGNKNKC